MLHSDLIGATLQNCQKISLRQSVDPQRVELYRVIVHGNIPRVDCHQQGYMKPWRGWQDCNCRPLSVIRACGIARRWTASFTDPTRTTEPYKHYRIRCLILGLSPAMPTCARTVFLAVVLLLTHRITRNWMKLHGDVRS